MGRLSLLGAGPQVAAAAGTNFKTDLWGSWPFSGGDLTANDGDDQHTTANHFDVEVGSVIDATGGSPESTDCADFGSGANYFEITSSGSDWSSVTKVSCAGWAYWNSGFTNFNTVLLGMFEYTGPSSAWMLLGLGTSNFELRFVASDNSASWPDYQNDYAQTDSADLASATWYHIAATCDLDEAADADVVKIYVNGTLEASTVTGTFPSAFDTMSSSADFSAGTHRKGVWNHDGRLYEWNVWKDRILTASEVTEHYNSGTPLKYSDY